MPFRQTSTTKNKIEPMRCANAKKLTTTQNGSKNTRHQKHFFRLKDFVKTAVSAPNSLRNRIRGDISALRKNFRKRWICLTRATRGTTELPTGRTAARSHALARRQRSRDPSSRWPARHPSTRSAHGTGSNLAGATFPCAPISLTIAASAENQDCERTQRSYPRHLSLVSPIGRRRETENLRAWVPTELRTPRRFLARTSTASGSALPTMVGV